MIFTRLTRFVCAGVMPSSYLFTDDRLSVDVSTKNTMS